jgi:sigma-B regulation protein RsbU (phosphoserine phosphatase)
MAKTASLFRCLGKAVRDPARLIGILNRELCATSRFGMFVTMVVGIYEPATGLVRFANAGHMPPLLKQAGHPFEIFEASAPPLGILSEAIFTPQTIQLEGRQLYLYSDGITELRRGTEDELGVEGLDRLLDETGAARLPDRLRGALAKLDQGGWQARDDLTLLAIDDALAVRQMQRDAPGPDAAEVGEFLMGFALASDPARLKILRPALLAAAHACGFHHDEAHDLVLAAVEAVENIMVHGYGGDRNGEITLAMHRLPDGMMLRIRDFAPKLDPAKIQPRSLDDVRPGGLGTHFIRAIMDDATFVPLPEGEGNMLELVKRHPPQGAEQQTAVGQQATVGQQGTVEQQGTAGPRGTGQTENSGTGRSGPGRGA